jgi:hypothetical protein
MNDDSSEASLYDESYDSDMDLHFLNNQVAAQGKSLEGKRGRGRGRWSPKTKVITI